MRAAAFSYAGNNTDNATANTGLGSVTPTLVLIKGGSNYAVWKIGGMGSNTAYFTNSATNFASGVKSLNNDGTITLGTNANVNAAATTYYGIAIYDDGAGDLQVGSYTGDGTAGQNVTLTISPDMGWVKRDGASGAVWKTTAMGAGNCLPFNNSAMLTDRLTALGTNQFSVGGNAGVNTAASTNYYAMFKQTSGRFQVFNYTGDGTSNKDRAILTLNPLCVALKGDSTVNAVFRTRNNVGDDTQSFANAANATGWIQSMNSGIFQTGSGTSVNGNGIVYYGYAFGGTIIPQVIYRRRHAG